MGRRKVEHLAAWMEMTKVWLLVVQMVGQWVVGKVLLMVVLKVLKSVVMLIEMLVDSKVVT
jgi:hypothetical protein